jgi:hypothetical protein
MVQQVDSSVGTLSQEELEMIRQHREEKLQAAGLIAPTTLTSSLDVANADGAVWIQNLANSPSRFADSNLGSFMLEAYGRMNSMQQVDAAFTRNPYLQRAEKRGRIRWVENVEARQIMDELVFEDEAPASNRLQQYLTEEASMNAGKRFITDLPDDAEQKSSISSDRIWSGDIPAQKKSVSKSAKMSDTAPTVLAPSSVLTEPIKEGEWTPEVPS